MKFAHAKKTLLLHQSELEKRGINSLSIFGSTANERATDKNDVDILVDFDSKKGLFGFVEVNLYIEELLNCSVDLVTRDALHPVLKDSILEEIKDVF